MKNQEAPGAQASNGILFNHEEPVWDEIYVIHKFIRAVAGFESGFQDRHYLDMFDVRRAWVYGESH